MIEEAALHFKGCTGILKWVLKTNGYLFLGLKCEWPSEEGPNIGFLYAFVLFPKTTAFLLLSGVLFLYICQLNYTLVLLWSLITVFSEAKYFYLWKLFVYSLVQFSEANFIFLFANYCGIYVHISSCKWLQCPRFHTASNINAETTIVHHYNLFSKLTFTY